MTKEDFDHGYKNGVADWEVFLKVPVTPRCTVCITTTGIVTAEGIDRIIEYLNLIKPSFEETVESSATVTPTTDSTQNTETTK